MKCKMREWIGVFLILTAFRGHAAVFSINSNTADQGWRADGSSVWAGQTAENRLGTETTANQKTFFVMPFQLPALPEGHQIATASLQIDVWAVSISKNSTIGIDVRGVRTSATATTQSSDISGGTLLVNNWMTLNTNLTAGTKTASDAALAAYLQGIYNSDPNAAGKYVFLSVGPDAAYTSNTHYVKMYSADWETASQRPKLTLTTAAASVTTNLIADVNDQLWRANGTSQWVGQATMRVGTETVAVGAVIPVWIPALNGLRVMDAELSVSIPDASGLTYASGLANADVYGVRSSASSVTTASDYSSGTKVVDNWFNIVTNLAIGEKMISSTNLAAWIHGQVGTTGGKYVFITIRPDAVDGTSRYATINSANAASGKPRLTLTLGTPPAEPVNVDAYVMNITDVWTNGTVRYPNADMRVGRQATATFSAGVMAFELPDLNGAAIVSANLKFRVNSVGAMTASNNCNIDIVGIRSGPMGSVIVSNDYRRISPLQTGEVLIQGDVVRWNDGSLPRDYETTGSATNTLGSWLADQYDSVGISGVGFLRLAADQDPVNNRYYTIPTDSISLTITTDGNTDPVSGFGNTVSARIGANEFHWTFDQNVNWGRFIDGMPWIVMPAGGNLSLVSAVPARVNNTNVKYYINSSVSGSTNADINITVRNPPFDHTFNTNTQKYVDNTNGVCGWDSRYGHSDVTASPKYNPSLGWNGTTWLPLSVGDSITTAKSTVQDLMTSRSSPLDALAVLTVLSNAPPSDAFRPGVIRGGTDRTNPEILRYSQLINLTPYLIPSPVGVTTDLRGTNISGIASAYTFNKLRACLPGPGFLNTGYSPSEGASAHYNNYAYPVSSSGNNYGGTLGTYMGQLAIGSLAGWLTEDERKLCRIRYIQRAIDAYSAIKAGLCVEEGCGILPGYSTLITAAGVMINHAGMKNVNNGVNGIKPWWVFADYACLFHTDGVPSGDLAAGETQNDRLVALYNTSANRSNLNRTNVQPIASAAAGTMTMKTNFWWDASRPMDNIINLKFKITGGAGAGATIYVITNTITTGVSDAEKFRKADGTLYSSGNVFGFCYGGKVGVKPAWQNGTPNSNSVFSFSITTRDADNPQSDGAAWYWAPDGVLPEATPVVLGRLQSICTSPIAEYSSIHTGGTVDNVIALYALGQQNLYKGGLDKYLINAGSRPGYGEVLFAGTYLDALGSGTAGNMRGALWKQEVLSAVGADFEYTDGTTGALDIPHTHAKMWFEP